MMLLARNLSGDSVPIPAVDDCCHWDWREVGFSLCLSIAPSARMNNITLSSMLNEFSTKNSLTDKDTLCFEKFASYSLLANDYYDSFDQDLVGTGNCVGVDAVAIAISDVLVYTQEAAKSLTTGQFDACFNFIQAKTSSNLDLGDYLKFLQTVSVFFSGGENDQPDELKNAYRIKAHIYSKAAKFRALPILNLRYVYTGEGRSVNSTIQTQINALVESIRAQPYTFSEVTSTLVGATELANLYKESLNRTTKHLMFQRHVALPKLASATAAYLGVAKCVDYIEILKNQHGAMNKGVFYDNVRDYLGAKNPVNADIEKTIRSTSQRNLFSVLNNGVTLVAKKVVPSGDTFEISGFQVVNGCQTSHVLFNNRKAVTDDMYLTVKLIETDDVDLSSSVIKATNSQSVVMKEAFATIKPYHKQLEDFFKAMNAKGHRFFYERRPHQYDDDESILNGEIVSAPLLIKSFVSVVIEEPHKVHFYYGQILRDYNNESNTLLFDENHHPGLYFVSHLLASKAKEAAARGKVASWSYHVALLIKKILGVRLDISDKITDERISKMIEDIQSRVSAAANQAVNLVKNMNFGRDENMIPDNTKMLLAKLAEEKAKTYIELGTASSTKSGALADGVYRVKNLDLRDGLVAFGYGPNAYSLKGAEGLPKELNRAICQVNIKNGDVVKVDD